MALSLSNQLAVCAGSFPGLRHTRTHRNNQDAIAVHVADDLLVVAVTDGCSQGASTEVGARFAASWLARWAPRYADAGAPAARWVDELLAALLASLAVVAESLALDADARPMVVNDFLLFSLLVAVVSEERTTIFGVGDGVFVVNGDATILDAGPENAPAYLAYALLDPRHGGIRGPRPMATIHHEGPTAAIRSLIVATDGAADLPERGPEPNVRDAPDDDALGLDQFTTQKRFARNPSLLQKRLVVLGEKKRLLGDDTTIGLIVRKELAQ